MTKPFNQKSSLSRREMLKLTGSTIIGAYVFGCSGATEQKTVTLFSAMGDVKNQAITKMAETFAQLHPDIRVEVLQVPWDQGRAKLITMVAGGNPPDLIVLTGQWMAEFRAMGAIDNLTSWYQTWTHKDAFTEIGIRRCEISAAIEDGQIYGLPLEITTRAMFYQKKWLDELGLEPAMTRSEWRTLLEKLTDPGKNRYGYAMRGARGGFWTWWPILEEFSGTNEWFDKDHRCIINGPDHVAGLSFWNDIYQDGLSPKDSLNWGYNELVQAFWSGICGCIEQDPEVVPTCLEHGMDASSLITAVMPAGPKAQVASNDIWILSRSSGAQNKEATQQFYGWVMAPEQLIPYSKATNVLPAVKQGMNDPAFNQGFFKPFMKMASNTALLQNWYPSYLPEMGEFIEVMVTEEQQNMLLKRQSPQDTLDKLADFLTKAQKKYVDQHGPDTPRPA
jgi:multiple sugar transport system substrate-binding protein